MMGKNWKERLSYWLDNQLAKGPWVLIGWLGLVVLALVFVLSFIAVVLRIQPADSGLKEVFWDFLFQALTPNPFDVTAPAPFLLIILVITILSLLMVSILIGLLTNGIARRLETLQRGRSRVLEKQHTVILGWSHQIFTIISELEIANQHRKHGAAIVIMAQEDKLEMEHAIRERLPHLRKTRVICRSGTPMELHDLEIVSPHTARSIIVLPPETDNPDAFVIKTILAITNNPKRRAGPYHVVTQVQTAHNMDVVNMISPQDDIHVLLVDDQIARIIAQTSRQAGLSVVYTELLNFSGSEIYFHAEPGLDGKSYAEILSLFEASTVIGLRLADGRLKINPAMTTQIASGDQVIFIAEEEDAIQLSNSALISLQEDAIRPVNGRTPTQPEKGLILGWNQKAPVIIRELENYVAPASQLVVVTNLAIEEEISAIAAGCQRQQVTFKRGDTSDRRTLNGLDIPGFHNIIVLADEHSDEQSADAETMVTLLHLRHILEKSACHPDIVSEMLDLRNRQLAEVARVDDFIVSDHLISLLLAQVSENSELYELFGELFDADGAEIYFKPIADYVEVEKPLSFNTLLEAARRRGETAIGYRISQQMNDAGSAYGIVLNPHKGTPVQFSAQDKVIVFAES